MRKLILACSLTLGFAAPLAAAQAAATKTALPQPMQMTVIAASPAPEMQQLQNEVQYIQTQVQALQAQQQQSDAYNLAELQNIPAGG